MSTSSYPVRVDATLDPQLSRGLWLVKWILVIPHYLCLVLLWAAFVVSSLVAFVAILVSGRYPRAMFEFNVGVLRWSWRVAYYAYGALGTDRYPPFTLRDVPDYPARLEVDYPEHLSRGLALVKWWLLAIPHYLVVAVFLGGGVYVADEAVTSDHVPWIWGGGLIGLLVLVAAVMLLVTGRYPRGVFDIVLGMNRWVLRVMAYAGLMTDQYPPFRFDQGGSDPGSGPLLTTSSPPNHTPSPAGPGGTPPPAGWSASRIVALVTGSVMLLVSGGFIAGGVGLTVADRAARDASGFVTSGTQTFTTDGYAITTENLEVHVDGAAAWVPETLLGDTRVTATAAPGSEVFLGIGPTAQVHEYLADAPHSVVVGRAEGDLRYRTTGGTDQPAAPVDLGLWSAQTSGGGQQVLTWTPENGDWTLVVMNVDGTRGVAADMAVAAELPALNTAVAVLLSVGGTLLVFSLVVIALAVQRASGQRAPGQQVAS